MRAASGAAARTEAESSGNGSSRVNHAGSTRPGGCGTADALDPSSRYATRAGASRISTAKPRPTTGSPSGTGRPVRSRCIARTTSIPAVVSNSRNCAPTRGLKSRSLYCWSRRSKRQSRSTMPRNPRRRHRSRDISASRVVAHGPGVARHTGLGRPRAVLHAGERDEGLGRRVAVAVEDPVLGDVARDVLLEHHRRRVGPGGGEGEQRFGRLQDGAEVHRRVAQPAERVHVLGHHGEHDLLGEGLDLLQRGREDGAGDGDAELDTGVVEPTLAGQAAGQAGRDLRRDEPGSQLVGVLGDEDRGLVVGRQRHHGPAELPADSGEDLEQARVVLEAGRGGDDPTGQVVRQRGRGEAVLRDGVGGNPRAGERPDRADATVVQRVVPDLHDEQRHAPVERAHILT